MLRLHLTLGLFLKHSSFVSTQLYSPGHNLVQLKPELPPPPHTHTSSLSFWGNITLDWKGTFVVMELQSATSSLPGPLSPSPLSPTSDYAGPLSPSSGGAGPSHAASPGLSPMRGPSPVPGFSGQSVFNYNQLEGRFKQLQGKTEPRGIIQL